MCKFISNRRSDLDFNFEGNRRSDLGFNFESIINANCDFSPKVQLLKYSHYYATIDSLHVYVHVIHMLSNLH